MNQTITVKLLELLNAHPVLKELAGEKFSAATSYKLMRLMDEVEPHIRAFYQVRDDAVRRYGKPDDENHDTISVTPDNQDVFQQEMKELINSTVELLGVEPIRIEWLDHIDLSPEEIRQLRCLINEPILEQAAQV